MSRNLRVGELLICCDLVGQSVGGHLVRASVGSNVSHGQLSVILSDNLSANNLVRGCLSQFAHCNP